MIIKIDSVGRILIPKPIRKMLGLEADTEIKIEIIGKKIIIEKVESGD